MLAREKYLMGWYICCSGKGLLNETLGWYMGMRGHF